MSNIITQETANLVTAMEEQLKNKLLKNEPDKLWENNFIMKQIEKRKKGKKHLHCKTISVLWCIPC